MTGQAEPAAAAPVGRDLHREAVTDLVGALAYGELSAFTRLAADARLAPSIADQVALAGFAARRFGAFQLLRKHLAELGIDAEVAMVPFVGALDRFHELTEPADWLESLVKAYVGDGIARDFYREMAALLDAGVATPGGRSTRSLVADLLAEETGDGEFFVTRVRASVEREPVLGGRLALWARRLVGEALSQTQHAAVDRDALLVLVSESGDLADLVRLLARVTEAHTARMAALGLSG